MLGFQREHEASWKFALQWPIGTPIPVTPPQWWSESGARLLTPATLALLVLRLRRPRPGRRRLLLQPGAVALVAALLGIIAAQYYEAGLRDVVQELARGVSLREAVGAFFWHDTGPYTTVAVAVAWLTLAISGRWRREPGWLDAVGTILGIFWLVQPLAILVVRG